MTKEPLCILRKKKKQVQKTALLVTCSILLACYNFEVEERILQGTLVHKSVTANGRIIFGPNDDYFSSPATFISNKLLLPHNTSELTAGVSPRRRMDVDKYLCEEKRVNSSKEKNNVVERDFFARETPNLVRES